MRGFPRARFGAGGGSASKPGTVRTKSCIHAGLPRGGVNRQIVEHGGNGFRPTPPEAGGVALRNLCQDPALRARMGTAGRREVEDRYCLLATASRLVEILRGGSLTRGKGLNPGWPSMV
jgi:glycosyltransferase involved in cell wall biosynthesis